MAADLVTAITQRIDDDATLTALLEHVSTAPKRFYGRAMRAGVNLPVLVYQNVAGRTVYDARLTGYRNSYWDFHVYALSDDTANAICKRVLVLFKGWTEPTDESYIRSCLDTYHREGVDMEDGPDGRTPVFHHQRTFHFIEAVGR